MVVPVSPLSKFRSTGPDTTFLPWLSFGIFHYVSKKKKKNQVRQETCEHIVIVVVIEDY